MRYEETFPISKNIIWKIHSSDRSLYLDVKTTTSQALVVMLTFLSFNESF